MNIEEARKELKERGFTKVENEKKVEIEDKTTILYGIKKEDLLGILGALNELEVKGVENMQRILAITNVLQNAKIVK